MGKWYIVNVKSRTEPIRETVFLVGDRYRPDHRELYRSLVENYCEVAELDLYGKRTMDSNTCTHILLGDTDYVHYYYSDTRVKNIVDKAIDLLEKKFESMGGKIASIERMTGEYSVDVLTEEGNLLTISCSDRTNGEIVITSKNGSYIRGELKDTINPDNLLSNIKNTCNAYSKVTILKEYSIREFIGLK